MLASPGCKAVLVIAYLALILASLLMFFLWIISPWI